MGEMTKDEVNISLFDEVKSLQMKNAKLEAKVKKQADEIKILETKLAIRDGVIRSLKDKQDD